MLFVKGLGCDLSHPSVSSRRLLDRCIHQTPEVAVALVPCCVNTPFSADEPVEGFPQADGVPRVHILSRFIEGLQSIKVGWLVDFFFFLVIASVWQLLLHIP